MLFSKTALLSLAALVSASPCQPTDNGPKPFGVVAIRSDSPVHHAPFQARTRGLAVLSPNQGAQCDRETNEATFILKDGALLLYADESLPVQRVFVDRSGMGQGIVGYLTGDSGAPRNAELTGWEVNGDGHLVFKGTSLQACPGAPDGSWSLWMSGVQTPGGHEGCLGIAARVVKATNPNSCTYTQ